MPQRLEFPEIVVGPFSVAKNGRNENIQFLNFQTDVSSDENALWLPFDVEELITDFIQMCSELLLAGLSRMQRLWVPD